MAPITKKRSQPDGAQGWRKRKRTDTDQDALQRENVDSKAIALDDLPWSTVCLPSRLENAEGFYGLEEIADVKVVKTSGKLEYMVGEKYFTNNCHFLTKINQPPRDRMKMILEDERTRLYLTFYLLEVL